MTLLRFKTVRNPGGRLRVRSSHLSPPGLLSARMTEGPRRGSVTRRGSWCSLTGRFDTRAGHPTFLENSLFFLETTLISCRSQTTSLFSFQPGLHVYPSLYSLPLTEISTRGNPVSNGVPTLVEGKCGRTFSTHHHQSKMSVPHPSLSN